MPRIEAPLRSSGEHTIYSCRKQHCLRASKLIVCWQLPNNELRCRLIHPYPTAAKLAGDAGSTRHCKMCVCNINIDFNGMSDGSWQLGCPSCAALPGCAHPPRCNGVVPVMPVAPTITRTRTCTLLQGSAATAAPAATLPNLYVCPGCAAASSLLSLALLAVSVFPRKKTRDLPVEN